MLTGSPTRRLTAYAAVGSMARAANAGLPTAIILGVLAASGSASEASLIVAAVTAVAGIIGPLVGALMDRAVHPRRGYALAILGLAACAAALAVGVGSWPLGVLMLIAGVAGLFHPMLTGAWSAQLRRVVPDVAPARAYAVDVGTYNVGDIVGPAIVGIAYVYDASTPGAASLEVVVVLYVLAALVLPLVPIPSRSADELAGPRPTLRSSVRDLGIFWRSVALRRSTIISTLAFIGIAGLVIGAPLMGQDLAGDAGIGALLLAVVAGGALIGSVVYARSPIRRIGPGTVVVVTTVGLGVAFAALAIVPSMAIAFVVAAILGFLEAPQLTGVLQVRDREAPQHVRSLVFVAATSLKTGAFALGSVIAAALVEWGWRVLLAGGAVIEILAVVLGLLIAGHRPALYRGTPPDEVLSEG
ncbi:MAG: MFS transporter [Candidatus Nanopelagicales bacterium]